jgi:hypothetical protein
MKKEKEVTINSMVLLIQFQIIKEEEEARHQLIWKTKNYLLYRK